MKNITTLISSLLLFAATLTAQQDRAFTNYMFNQSIINPAFTGSESCVHATLLTRQQWLGFEDFEGNKIHPQNYLMNLETPLFSINSGLGVIVQYDNLPLNQNLNIRLNYAYHKKINDSHALSGGLSFDLSRRTLNFDDFVYFDPGDPLLASSGKQSGSMFDLGLGMQYVFKENLFAGVSIYNVLGSKTEVGSVELNQQMLFNLMAGYEFKILDRFRNKLDLVAGALYSGTKSSNFIEVHAILKYNDFIYGGLTYKTPNEIGVLAGLKWNNLSVGAAYDLGIKELSNKLSYGSPEVYVSYCFPIKPKVKMKGFYNVRLL
ncbi:MAG: PorP/SprF family type IX secretion system membrane protein [Lentimicrobium sp.]|jgi:type IX secretion system PorP/SprF family membrane protein|nr:PorP/SprF family type IX secretion system membrane protein [Lentimicrobium sp.]